MKRVQREYFQQDENKNIQNQPKNVSFVQELTFFDETS